MPSFSVKLRLAPSSAAAAADRDAALEAAGLKIRRRLAELDMMTGDVDVSDADAGGVEAALRRLAAVPGVVSAEPEPTLRANGDRGAE